MKSGGAEELKGQPAAKSKQMKLLFNLPKNQLSGKPAKTEPTAGFSTERKVSRVKTEASRQKVEGSLTERRQPGESRSIGNFGLIRDLIKGGTGENYGWIVGLRSAEPSANKYTG